jgi:hypothetical protein
MPKWIPTSYGGLNLNDGTAFVSHIAPEYEELAPQSVTTSPRSENWPVYAGKVIQGKNIPLIVQCIAGGTAITLPDRLDTLKQIFDTFQQTPTPLYVYDSEGLPSDLWYVNATPVSMPEVSGGVAHIVLYAADPVWEAFTAIAPTFNVGTAGTGSGTISVACSSECYPIYQISPTQAKTGTFAYKRAITVVNNSSNALINYPVNVAGTAPFATNALVAAGKMQADGDDLRIWQNNIEIPRWLNGINSGTTWVWSNLTISAGGTASLTMLYGSTAVAAPTQDETMKPIIELNSTDSSWIYENFATLDEKRTAGWDKVVDDRKGKESNTYTVTHADDDDPASVMGMSIAAWVKRDKWMAEDATLLWKLYHPCGVTSVNFTTEAYRANTGFPSNAVFQKSANPKHGKFAYKNVITVASPGTAAVWGTAVSGATSLSGTFNYLRWLFDGSLAGKASNIANLQVNSGTLTIANAPTVTLGVEAANYHLNATIANTTTGESFTITGVMAINTSVYINTKTKTAYWDSPGGTVNILPGLTLSTVRNEWLHLNPALQGIPTTNVITYTEAGAVAVGVGVSYFPRML